MKRLFAVIMLFLTALSVGGVILYSVHKTMATGGAAPEIHFAQEEIAIKTSTDDSVLLQGVTATDQEDGDVTESIMVEGVSHFVEPNVVNVTYVAYDSQNHVSRAMRRVRFTDYTGPRFSMKAPMVFSSKNVTDLLNNISASDMVDGNISIKMHAAFDDTNTALAAEGSHDVEISVTNSLGDTARLTVPVLVMEDAPHSEKIPLKTYLAYIDQGAEFDPAFYLADEDQAAANEWTGERSVQIASGVNTARPGTYTVDYSILKDDTVTAITRLIVVVV